MIGMTGQYMMEPLVRMVAFFSRVLLLLLSATALLLPASIVYAEEVIESSKRAAAVEPSVSGQTPPASQPVDSQLAVADKADDVVRQVTERMQDVLKENKHTLEENPEAYYRLVEAALDPFVDFEFIADGVMGVYVSEATPQQRQQFATTFKRGLISTYAKGMAGYSEHTIVTLPLASHADGRQIVSVMQEVHTSNGINRVSYTMKRNSNSEWKLINVVLNGINLGKTFRSQFAQAMKKNQGKLNVVIENWAATNS